jgi:glycosyltransferase involved in cell wall biosynthesis
MITYAHEPFIKQAVEGVLQQSCDFDVELIIADDCSPDNTFEIVNDIIINHPKGHWINYTRHLNNKGMMTNFAWALEKCKGKYVALCEGDDYWIDEFKLQKQVNYLKDNISCAICAHNVVKGSVVSVAQKLIPNVSEYTKFTLFDFIQKNLIATCSIVFERSALPEKLPQWFVQLPFGDWTITLMILKLTKGYCCVLPDISSVYRLHEDGVYSSLLNDDNTRRKAFEKQKKFIKRISDVLLYEKQFRLPILRKKLMIFKKLYSLNYHCHNLCLTLKYLALYSICKMQIHLYNKN